MQMIGRRQTAVFCWFIHDNINLRAPLKKHDLGGGLGGGEMGLSWASLETGHFKMCPLISVTINDE